MKWADMFRNDKVLSKLGLTIFAEGVDESQSLFRGHLLSHQLKQHLGSLALVPQLRAQWYDFLRLDNAYMAELFGYVSASRVEPDHYRNKIDILIYC